LDAQSTPHSNWRGVIEHLPTGKKQSINQIEDLLNFIHLYLDENQPKIQAPLKFRHWVKRILFQKSNE
ncbi:MAG: hypothetical protein AAF490_27100, partial [Chloroflexota bacterium]